MKDFQNIQNEIYLWQKTTFPTGTIIGKMKHLQKECAEVINEIEKAYNGSGDHLAIEEEFADCFILLTGAAAHYGLTMEEIYDAMRKKLEINKKRKWGQLDSDGISKHI